MKKPFAHDKALQASYQEYGRYIQAGEGSMKAIERAIEIYIYVVKQYAIPPQELTPKILNEMIDKRLRQKPKDDK